MKERHDVRVGDMVYRYLAGVAEMELQVSDVTPDRITCGLWTFDKATGAEIDEDLGWGPESGITGSYILAERGKANPDGGFSPSGPRN